MHKTSVKEVYSDSYCTSTLNIKKKLLHLVSMHLVEYFASGEPELFPVVIVIEKKFVFLQDIKIITTWHRLSSITYQCAREFGRRGAKDSKRISGSVRPALCFSFVSSIDFFQVNAC